MKVRRAGLATGSQRGVLGFFADVRFVGSPLTDKTACGVRRAHLLPTKLRKTGTGAPRTGPEQAAPALATILYPYPLLLAWPSSRLPYVTRLAHVRFFLGY